MKQDKQFDSAVIVPMYNEAETLPGLILALSAQYGLELGRHALVLVDDGSTDDTVGVAERALEEYRLPYEAFIETHAENQGTGAATDTGMRFAIDELGAKVLARTDADTLPMELWHTGFLELLHKKPHKKIVRGSTRYRISQMEHGVYIEQLIVLARVANGLRQALIQRSPRAGLMAPGHNMATTADAYDATGGFKRASYLDGSDDNYYTQRVAAEFGFRSFGVSTQSAVFTSMRRYAEMGLLKTARFYATEDPEKRRRLAS